MIVSERELLNFSTDLSVSLWRVYADTAVFDWYITLEQKERWVQGLYVQMDRGRMQRKTWCMGPLAGVDYNLALCILQSQLQHFTLGGQPYARVDLNPMPEPTLFPSQGGPLDLASGTRHAMSGLRSCVEY